MTSEPSEMARRAFETCEQTAERHKREAASRAILENVITRPDKPSATPETDAASMLGGYGQPSRIVDAEIARSLETRLVAAMARERWIPVAENLPEPHIKRVFCLQDDGTVSASEFPSGWAGMRKHAYITHWRHIPTPPNAKGAA